MYVSSASVVARDNLKELDLARHWRTVDCFCVECVCEDVAFTLLQLLHRHLRRPCKSLAVVLHIYKLEPQLEVIGPARSRGACWLACCC